jgi:alpha-L-rhamnosidase
MYVIQAALETYMQTGDVAPLAQNYATLQKKLPDKWFDPATGLIHKSTGSNGANSVTDDDIVDWPASDRDGYVFTAYNTVINAIGYRSYADMATIAAALGHTDDAATYRAKAEAISQAVNARMWDDVAGTYRDGLQNADMSPIPHDALQAGVFAVAFGLVGPSRAARVAAYIDSRGMACSVYCAAFLIQAAYAGDRPDVASGLLSSTGSNSWMNMIAQGAGATMEAWTTTEKPNLTYSHPWAASPAFNVPRSMFGIRPTKPGYDTLDIKPQPGDVAWAHITVPSVKGEIGAAFDSVGGRTDVGAWVPANAVARVLVPGVPAGTTSIYEDGTPVGGVVTDGFFAVDGVQPGCHVFTTNPGVAPYLDDRLTTVCAGPVQVSRQAQGDVGGYVPATLALSLGGAASFGSFVPGVEAEYSATTTATVTSTAGDAALSVQDPGAVVPGHLVNGAYALAQPLLVAAGAGAFAPVAAGPTTLLAYDGPVANDAVALHFRQAIGANEPLRTGSYGKTLTYTLSTDTP